ncbi:MAG: hypothetical protein KQ78_01210 [Candidatus Izimaplasma bacterium HR2]|nr:MAG: hypothetical protein KQ78_01210 [Candidatus Izimaplasma bacterium HR2]
MKLNETYNLFWGGIYSQWTISPIHFYGIDFNCNEQMMMYGKAITFDDHERAREVMATSIARNQKALGRRVRNFDFKKWDVICNDLVYTANYCKFTQNYNALKILLFDKSDLIVEASPYDKVWGIGLGKDDPRALIRSEWLGENRLGQIITDVRTYLRDPSLCIFSHDDRIKNTIELFNHNSIFQHEKD